MKNLEKNYLYDEEKRFWHGKKFHFGYSDGNNAEEYMLNVLKRVYDKGLFSKELAKMQKDWASVYHFSPLRANLLRPFQKRLGKNARILELGCGCGAVTRYLGECGGEVLAVEGSERRAQMAALRCKGLDNVTVLLENIQNLDPDVVGKFDVVTLIGVFEYSRVYAGGKGAEHKILEKVRSLLKDDGVLILAIENKLGLAYFAGILEDHIGIPWGGICNVYDENGVVTYSRKELTELFFRAGFVHLEQFVPVPDYKMPVSVITQKGLDMEEEFDSAAFCSNYLRKFQNNPLFNLGEAWQSVVRAGLLSELANSLCFVASVSEPKESFAESGVLAEHYSILPTGQKKYAKKMSVRQIDGSLRCVREYLYPELSAEQAGIKNQARDEPYYKGTLLVDKIRNAAVKPGWKAENLAQAFLPWYAYLQEISSENGKFLPADALDLTPFNCILDSDGKIRAFDLEWSAEDKISFDMVLVRGIVITLYKIGVAAKPADPAQVNFGFLVKNICKYLGRDFSDEHLARLFGEENVLDKQLFGCLPDWESVKNKTLYVVEYC